MPGIPELKDINQLNTEKDLESCKLQPVGKNKNVSLPAYLFTVASTFLNSKFLVNNNNSH